MGLIKETATADAEMITRGYLALARLQIETNSSPDAMHLPEELKGRQARGESNQALATLDAFTQVADQRGFAPILLAHGAAMRAQVELAQGNLAAAIRWAETCGLPEISDLSYPREQEYLTLVRVHIAQGREHPTSPFLSQALVLLERLQEDAEAKMRMRSVLEILVLRALALSAQSNIIEALAALGRALPRAEPEGYIQLFLDEGEPMVTLLRQAYAHSRAPSYVAALLKASGELIATDLSRSSSRTGPLMEALTLREREVLRLLMDGLSNREIARHLILSVNTVKKHVYNICRKLGVQSRAHALARARTLSLLLGAGDEV
jgi:LuxR family maltose regulon positive regulatory protein